MTASRPSPITFDSQAESEAYVKGKQRGYLEGRGVGPLTEREIHKVWKRGFYAGWRACESMLGEDAANLRAARSCETGINIGKTGGMEAANHDTAMDSVHATGEVGPANQDNSHA